QSHPRKMAILVTDLEQQMQSQADAEELLAPGDVLLDGRRQARLVHPGDGVAEGADTRQHQLVAVGDAVGVGADLGSAADLLGRLLHAAQVGHPVVDDQDRGRHEGVPSAGCGSRGGGRTTRRKKLAISRKNAPPTASRVMSILSKNTRAKYGPSTGQA